MFDCTTAPKWKRRTAACFGQTAASDRTNFCLLHAHHRCKASGGRLTQSPGDLPSTQTTSPVPIIPQKQLTRLALQLARASMPTSTHAIEVGAIWK
jgi:hypothetical protein